MQTEYPNLYLNFLPSNSFIYEENIKNNMHLHLFHPQFALQARSMIISLIRWSRIIRVCYGKLVQLYKEYGKNNKMLVEVTVSLVLYFYLLSCWPEADKLVFLEILKLKG